MVLLTSILRYLEKALPSLPPSPQIPLLPQCRKQTQIIFPLLRKKYLPPLPKKHPPIPPLLSLSFPLRPKNGSKTKKMGAGTEMALIRFKRRLLLATSLQEKRKNPPPLHHFASPPLPTPLLCRLLERTLFSFLLRIGGIPLVC